jgi:hypothetical protein
MQKGSKQNMNWWRKSYLFGVAAGTSLLMTAGSAWAQQGTMEEEPYGGGMDQHEQHHQPGDQLGQQPRMGETMGMQGDVNQQILELRQEVQDLKALYSAQLFADFVNNFQREQAFEQHTNIYAVRGLRHLTFTIGQIIPVEDQQLKQRQQQLQERVIQIEQLPRDQQQQQIGQLFVEAANLLSNVQQQYYPQFQDQAQQLMQTAQQMQDVQQLQQEAQRINNFMVRASLAVERMAQTPTEAIGGGPIDGIQEPGLEEEPGMMEPGLEEEPGMQQPGVEEEPGIQDEPLQRDQDLRQDEFEDDDFQDDDFNN